MNIPVYLVEDFPDLSHWKSVEEFKLEEAALLLASIDPFDYTLKKG